MESNLSEWMTNSHIKVVYRSSRYRQPIKRYPKEVEEPFGNNAEYGPWINLYSFNARRADASSIIQRSIVFIVFEEHILVKVITSIFDCPHGIHNKRVGYHL